MNNLPADWQDAEYGSHWELLTRVMEQFKPRRILETGSGLYSTNLFLSFDIDVLVSIENNLEWQVPNDDPRHSLVCVEGPVHEWLPPLASFDLVFVDDDPVDEREQTLRRVLMEAPFLVMAHDADWPAFHAILKGYNGVADTTRKPHTAVLCPTNRKEFRKWQATVTS